MTDLASVLKAATRVRRLGITRRQVRERLRQLIREADAARDRRDWPEACRLYREALDADPSQRGICVQLGHAYKELGDLANAGICYYEVLQATPIDDDIYLQIGHLEKLKGDLREAALAYRKSALINPLNRDAAAEYAALASPLGLPPLPHAPVESMNGATLSGVGGIADTRPAADLEPLDSATAAELCERGDRARDARRWPEAARAYKAYLACEPDDFAIWVQYGHALKEAGDPTASEHAYRTALALVPDDADLHLQLGHLLKLSGRGGDAVKAYRRSFRLHPLRTAWIELRALDLASDELALHRPATATRSPQIFVDVSDLLTASSDVRIVEARKIQLGVLTATLSDPDGARSGFTICRDNELWVLPEQLLADLARGGINALPPLDDSDRPTDDIEAQSVLYTPVAGDIVVTTGVIDLAPDLVAQRARLKQAGVRVGAYIHDFLPLTHPEFFAASVSANFAAAASEALLQLDFLLTGSQHAADEARRLAQQAGYPALPIRPVPPAQGSALDLAPTGDVDDRRTGAIAPLRGREFVLCAGALGAANNQSFLVQVWQLLVRQGGEPPVLVLAGTLDHGVEELEMRLAWDAKISARVEVIERPSDEELAALYDHCLFTVAPSTVEDNGAAIAESLAHGKLCIAAEHGAVPGAGSDGALYIDPFNVRACADLVRDLLADRAALVSHEVRIRAGFKPRGWRDYGRDFLTAARDRAAAGEEASANKDKLAPGTILRPRVVKPQTAEPDRMLPRFTASAAAVKARSVLIRGWYPPEPWGTWIAGRHARLGFFSTAPAASVVTVVLQCRAAPWSRNNGLNVTSACGASTSVTVPDASDTATDWRGQTHREMVVGIDCKVAEDGSISLLLEVTGPIVSGWWDDGRLVCVGLVRLTHVPAAAARGRQAPNRRIQPGALTGPAGKDFYPLGLRSMLGVLHRNRLLAGGWERPQEWGVWMSGGSARVALATDLSSGEGLRVVLQLRAAAAASAGPRGALQVSLAAACGASRAWRLPADSYAEPVWLDCTAGDDGRVDLEITDLGSNGGLPGHRIGLVGVVYGRHDTTENRLALTEAILYPETGDAGSTLDAATADLRFAIVGHIKGTYSLAAINRSLALGLESASPGSVRIEQVETDPVRDLDGVPAAEHDSIRDFTDRPADPSGAEVAIVQHWPVLKPPPGCDLPLALFAWEEGLVPRDIVEHFNRHYRGMVAQTRAVSKALLDSGIAIPVHMVGCAIDLSRFAAIAERRAAASPRPPVDRAHPFVFLHVSSCFPRKGVDILLAAYAEAFRADDPVRLVIKGFPNPHNDVAQQIERLRASDPGLAAIDLIDRDLEEDALLALFETADAMVLPTRGEGFNMPAAEAMAAGLPLIVTGFGGQMDFVGPEVARTIDYKFAPSQSHVRSAASVWVEPDTADLSAALRETLAQARTGDGSGSPFAAQIERARRAAMPLADRAQWGRRVAAAASALMTSDAPGSVTVGWVSTWKVRCGIAEYSRLLLSHFEDAARDVKVFCDERTDHGALASDGGPAAQIAWRILDEPSMDGLAAAIERAGVDSVVIQHHEGFLGWPQLIRLLHDRRVNSRPVLVFLHHARNLLSIDPGSCASIIAALRLAARVLVHSVSDLNVLKSLGLVENVALFPHGAPRWDLTPRPVRSFASGEAPLLGAYGFFLPHKGFDRVVQALPALRNRWRGLRLRFVTAEFPEQKSADEVARCRELARSLGVAEAIEWITDYLPDHRSLELLSECDLIALPYLDTTESASGAARVAIASRAPVAVSPIRIFEDLDQAVLRFTGTDANTIAAGIAAMLDDAAARRKTVAEAGKWLESHDWKLMAARLQGMATGIVATSRTGG